MYAAMNDQEASELRLFHEEIREMGIDCKLMNGTEARRLEPLLCRDVVGALHNPSCYHLNPFRLIVGYLDAALRRRCRAKYGVDVKEIKINNGRIERGRT